MEWHGVLKMNDKPKYRLKDESERKKHKNAGAEQEQPVFKTEEMLKQEARERLVEQEKHIADKPPLSARQKKIDNYLYHYKWHTIIACIGVVLIFFFVRDTIFRAKPDFTVIIASSRFITQAETDAIQAGLAKYTADINGDGKILINFDSINIPIAEMLEDIGGYDPQGTGAEGAAAATGAAETVGAAEEAEEAGSLMDIGSSIDPEMMQASMMKLMAIVAAWTDQLYLLDDDLYNYINMMAGPATDEDDAESQQQTNGSLPDYAVFDPLGLPFSFGPFDDRLAIKDTILVHEPGFEFLGDMAFSLRPPPNNKQQSIDYYDSCMKLLMTLAGAG